MTVYKVPAYLDYNRGTGTGNGSAQTIAHGLSAKPKRVRIYPTGTPSATVISQTEPDTTNIYVTCTTGQTYLWIAELW